MHPDFLNVAHIHNSGIEKEPVLTALNSSNTSYGPPLKNAQGVFSYTLGVITYFLIQEIIIPIKSKKDKIQIILIIGWYFKA